VHHSVLKLVHPSMLEFARIAAAMQELKDVREAFDLLVVRDTDR
jgi:hypothetical protein